MTDARHIAAQALQDILGRKALLEDALSKASGFQAMEKRDRDFARLLVATVLRRKGQVDSILNGYINRTPPAMVMQVLRIGAVQILFLGTPPHAAVGESVSQIKSSKKFSKFSGLVNAVLRKIVKEGSKKLALTSPQDNLPDWIKRSWDKAYGRAQTARMARQLATIPPLDLTVKSDAPKWAEKLGGEVIGRSTVRLPKSTHVPNLEGFETGDWWVQDFSASLPVQLLGDIKGMKVADICAAPGGKTLQLAAAGANVTAIDKSAKRLERVQDNLTRTQLDAKIIEADAIKWLENTDETFDVILIDAPCTATGTFRRHPDVLYNKDKNQLHALTHIQQKLLIAAAKKINPGGRIVYCTCSLQPEEGEVLINDYLKLNENFSISPLPDWIGAIDPNITLKHGYLRALPHALGENGGADGFFTVMLNLSKN